VDIELERHENRVLLRIKGDLRLWNRADAEEDAIARFYSILEEPPAELVLNLQETSHVDPRGIAVLVRIQAACFRRAITLKVVLPAGAAGDLLRHTHIFEACPQFENEAAAMAAGGTSVA